MPVFVVTHHARGPLVKEGGTTYFFITDGVEAALAQAKSTAGDEDVGTQGSSNVIRQLFNAGLVDELRIHLVHVLLGEGTRLFDATNAKHAGLESARTIQTPGATHLTFRILRKQSD